MTNQFITNLKARRELMRRKYRFTFLFVLFMVLTACIPVSGAVSTPTIAPASPSQQVQAHTLPREAQVQSVDIKIIQAGPVLVNAIVRGSLSESCATFIDPQVRYTSKTFEIKLMTVSPDDRGCLQVTTPFEQSIALDTTNLTPGAYTVIANGVSTVFTLPSVSSQLYAELHLVVYTSDQIVQIKDLNIALSSIGNPAYNSMLPSGGAIAGTAYVLDSTDQNKVVAINASETQKLSFIQKPTSYGLATWRGSSDAQSHLAWGTQSTGSDTLSSLQMSAPDGSNLQTLLTQEETNPPVQLVAEFWSADGQSLYFSKEPMGLGGYILFGGASNLYKINITTKEVTELIPLGPSSGPQACLDAVSADFRYVADHCSGNKITIRDLTSSGTTTILPPADLTGFRIVGSARFNPDGSRLAYALAKSDQESEQGWVAVSDGTNGGSKLILTSQVGTYYTIAGWLDDRTLLVQSTNLLDCTPYCTSELWTVTSDGTDLQKVADGSLLAVITDPLSSDTLPTTAFTPSTTECTDSAQYISDDGLDGSTYAPNTAFTKTWTLKNTGTCTWDSNYMVYQLSGAYMTQQPGYWLLQQGRTVAPGQTLDVSVGMTSPVGNGNYKAYWGLKNGNGQVIPIQGGSDGNSFYVKIRVNDGSADTGAVTATSIDIIQEQGSGEICTASATYFVHAYISTDGPTTVSYEIGSSAGQISAGYFEDNNTQSPYVTGTLKFEQADDKKVNLRFVGPYPYPNNISVMLRVNNGEWVSTKLVCP
jgi:hypothetical protein